MPLRSRYSRCRSCRAFVVWADTVHGKRMMVDVDRRPDGNILLIWRKAYDEPLADVLGERRLQTARAEAKIAYEQGLTDEPELRLNTRHLDTCPQADQDRRSRRVAA